MTELLSCPFCGSNNAEVFAYGMEREKQHPCDRSHAVSCEDCGGLGPEIAPRSAAIDRWNTRAQPPSQVGEAVEVVASIAVDAEGVVRDFTLEPGLDRHPGGYTVTPLMTVAQHQRILASSVGSGDPVAWRVTGRDGLTVTAQYPEWAEADCLLTITPLYTHPAEQVADDPTMVKVSRELLEDLRDLAFDQVEHHRAAMGAYKQTRQSAMDSALAQADALLEVKP